MSSEEYKVFIRKMNEAANKKGPTVVDKFMALDYVDQTNQLRGRDDVRQFYIKVFKDLPDFHRTIEDIIAEGDRVWVRFKITGTAPSDKKIEQPSASFA
jgi:predicted ester cyclase